MISFKNVTYSYPQSSERDLNDINLLINKGEVVAFTGLSGCGKTTLTRVINGLAYKYYGGKIEGELNISDMNPFQKELYEIGKVVGSIFQNPKSQFFSERVEDEIAFGLENHGVEREQIDYIISKSLESINGEQLRNKNLFQLSSGERQKIAIASINALDPSIYVFDEPSANLDMESVEALKRLLLSLKKAGKTIIISEHRLYYLKDIVDKYYYMSNGKLVCCYDQDVLETSSATFFRNLGLRQFLLDKVESNNKRLMSKNCLEIKKMTFSYGKKVMINQLNYDFFSGSVYGIIGENGVGKSTFSKVISGLLKERKGSIYYNSKLLKRNKRRQRVYYLSNNPASNLFEVSAREELMMSDSNVDSKRLLREYNLSDVENVHPQILSGGEKQRLTIAVSELLERDVYIFDEPTSGLDGKNMKLVSNKIKNLQRKQKIVIVISHDYEFLMEACTTILHMNESGFTEFEPKTEQIKILEILQGRSLDDDK
ncbi:MAG: ABC transporter ATP-binding protein [Firmicutes bacterium]|nr:ABC transporter ATP-binding protein [Bacillota bacterium]